MFRDVSEELHVRTPGRPTSYYFEGPPPTSKHLLLVGASTDARRRPTTSTDAQRCSARLQLPANFFKGAGCFFRLCRRNCFAKFYSNLSICISEWTTVKQTLTDTSSMLKGTIVQVHFPLFMEIFARNISTLNGILSKLLS